MTVVDRMRGGSTPDGADAVDPRVDRGGDLSADPSADLGADPFAYRPLEWSDLPPSVRTTAIALAARALGALPADQVPAALAGVARFTPAKRSRVGAGLLGRALEHDAGFRAIAAQHLPDEVAGRADPATDEGGAPTDPVQDAARAFLLRLPGAGGLLAAAARAEEIATLRAEVAGLTTAVDKLTARLARLVAAQAPAGETSHASRGGGHRPAADSGQSEVERLRQRLREQGSRVKAAEQAAQAAVTRARTEVDEAAARAAREQASAENWRLRAEQEAHRAERAREALDRFRESTSQQRADSDRRLELLLDTVVHAAAGLQREWRLTAGGADPADAVARRLPGVNRWQRPDVDAPLLLGWLGQPHAHLIVDGYNVTKTGYPDLSLADQRDRLTRSLAALASRTGAEITVVFDGAAVVAAPSSMRGVRVVFSPPTVLADDVIRELAAAEPAGRVVIVVTSDREVVDGVRRSGARTAPSLVLLAAVG